MLIFTGKAGKGIQAFCLAALLVAGLGAAGPVNPHPPEFVDIPAYFFDSVDEFFAGGVRANVIVSGNARTYMGMYIFDKHGSCVALDDFGNRATFDDLAAEWYPPTRGLYSAEIHNFGRLECRAELAFP